MCNINHPKFPCRICAKNVHDKDEVIQCDLCKLWIHISDVSRDFWRDQFQHWVCGWRRVVLWSSLMENQTTKLAEAPRIWYAEITYFWLKYTLHNTTCNEANSFFFFSKIFPKFEFKENFSTQSCTSLSHVHIYQTHFLYFLQTDFLLNF